MGMITQDTFFIGGEFVAPAGTDRIEVINPATEEVLGSCPEGTTADMDRAVAAAREAFDHGPWPTHEPQRAGRRHRPPLGRAAGPRRRHRRPDHARRTARRRRWSIMGQVFSATMVLDAYVDIAKNHDWVTPAAGLAQPGHRPQGARSACAPGSSPGTCRCSSAC